MDTRKLVKSGYSSLVVALPKTWIEKNHLTHNDEVFITQQDNQLVIQKEYKKKVSGKTEKVIDIEGKPDRVIARDVISGYVNNYDYILLKGKSLKARAQSIKSMISGLIALELVDESSDKILAKNFLNMQDANISLLIRRMDNIIRSMMIDLKEAIKDNSLVESIVARDIEINKLNYLISKVLKTANTDPSIFGHIGIKSSEMLPYWEINGQLEKIGDRVKHIARLVPYIEPSCRKRFLELITQIEDYFKKAMKSFYESSTVLADEISLKKEDLGQDINTYASHKCINCSKIAIHIFNMSGHINDISRIVRYIINND